MAGITKITRNKMEQDFQEIDELATEGGTKAILDEASYRGEDLTSQFSKFKGFHEHAFWTFLERPLYWQAATAFNHADTIATSYWRKRNNISGNPVDISADNITLFELTLSDYFHKTQGRGKHCKVDHYKRNDCDYFFAYPEDYTQASIEWEGHEFRRRPHHPAFEVIFVYSYKDSSLDIYMTGDRKPLPDLQAIFAAILLKARLGNDLKDEQVYDLSPLWSRHFQFIYSPDSGIADVAIKKFRFVIRGENERITIEGDPARNKYAIYDVIEKKLTGIALSQITIMQIGIKVTFIQNPLLKKIRTRSFDISWPNSCSLKYDEIALLIRKMLIDSKLEPRKLSTEAISV